LTIHTLGIPLLAILLPLIVAIGLTIRERSRSEEPDSPL